MWSLPPFSGPLISDRIFAGIISDPSDGKNYRMPATRKPSPKDKNKLIRQLSLVAYLMSAPGRGVNSWDIRRNVEEYADMSDDAFARRFYADREELGGLGIGIVSGEQQGGYPEGNLYWLPPENYFLPQVDFSREELAALHTCLCVLDGQFAYSRPLRLALQSLALGTGNSLDDPVTDRISVNLLTDGFGAAVAAVLARIDTAASRRKTVIFDYHALGKDTVSTHTVDPYTPMFTRGDWYLVGYSRQRDAIRVFKLRRIRGKIRNATKNDHDFTIPEDYNPADYTCLEPWQLGPVAGSADIAFSTNRGWWARNNLAHCGKVSLNEDGSAIFSTDYSDGGQLCALVLGLWRDARLVGPGQLNSLILSFAEKVRDLHSGPPPDLPGKAAEQPAPPGRTGAAGPLPQVEPERFSKLATTVAYLMEKLGDKDNIKLPAPEVCRDLGYQDRGQLEKDVELLQMVNTGGGGGYLIDAAVKGNYLRVGSWPESHLLKRPPRLSPLEARALLLAIDLIGSQILSGQYLSLDTARDKILQAAGGLDEERAIPVGETEKEDFQICRALNRGLAERRLVKIEYLSRGKGGITTRRVEPYLITSPRGQWYVVAWCRLKNAIRTFNFEMIKSARLLEESFEPRDIDLDPYRRDPRFPSGRRAPGTATVWFSPVVSRWILEKQPDVTVLEDGSLTGNIPYFDAEWMIDEILKYRGEAVLVAPDGLRNRIAETAGRLAESYR